MANPHIAVVIGSLRKESINRKLANALIQMAPSGYTLTVVDIGHMPIYNQDADDQPEIESVKVFRDAIRNADAVLFVSPEYNRSMPGGLKNAIDQGSRPYGKSVWGGKAAAVIGLSPGATGTSMMQQHLRNVLANQNMDTMAQPEGFLQNREGFFAADGTIGEASHKFIQGWLDQFLAHVDRHIGAKAK